MSLSRITDNQEWTGAVGALVPLARAGGFVRVQAGAGATVFSRLLKTPGHITVLTVDYRVDLPIDVAFSSWAFRIGYGHRSAHYADDAIEQLGLRSISAVKDYLQGGAAWVPPEIPVTLYGIATWNYHNEPATELPWELQTGGELRARELWSFLSPYVAVDLKFKQEVAWGSTQSYQAGVRLFPRSGRVLRLSYTHRRGFEERGQVYAEQTVMNIITASLDLW